jgi:hypothetical protein
MRSAMDRVDFIGVVQHNHRQARERVASERTCCWNTGTFEKRYEYEKRKKKKETRGNGTEKRKL